MRELGAVAYATGVVLGAVLLLALTARFMATLVEGASVSSWFRSWLHNFDVGGLSNSAHLLGWAVDLVPATADVEARARKLFPVVVNEGDHIHAAFYKA